MDTEIASIISAQLCGAIDNLTEAVREVAAQLHPLAALGATTQVLDEHLSVLAKAIRPLQALEPLAESVREIADTGLPR